jgi:hypothetical protein
LIDDISLSLFHDDDGHDDDSYHDDYENDDDSDHDENNDASLIMCLL